MGDLRGNADARERWFASLSRAANPADTPKHHVCNGFVKIWSVVALFSKSRVDSLNGVAVYSATDGDAATGCGAPDLASLELSGFVGLASVKEDKFGRKGENPRCELRCLTIASEERETWTAGVLAGRSPWRVAYETL